MARFLFLSLFFFQPLFAAQLELVQSVPVETNLAVPGIRDAREVWLEIIQGSKRTLDIEQFYISDEKGEALTPILTAIQEAGKRGVRVRLVADAKFFKTYPESILLIGKAPHSEARTIDYSALSGIQHSKFFIADGEIAFLGSHNFDWRALTHIHEIGVRIEDRAIASDLTRVFEVDWKAGQVVASAGPGQESESSSKNPESSKSETIFIAAPQATTPKDIPYSLDAIVELIDSARKTLRIQVMEYSTRREDSSHWKVLDAALKRAGDRGVRVELLLDQTHAEKAKEELRSLADHKNIDVGAANIPKWSGGDIPYARLIHSKYLLADGERSWIGTENWSEGYFTRCRDVGITTTDKTIARNLGRVFERVWQSEYVTKL